MIAKRLFFLPFGLFLLIFLSACATLGPGVDRVRVHIADIQPLKSTLMEQRYRVTLRVQNRSGQALHADGVSFDLRLNGRDFASGVSNHPLEVPPLSEATVEVAASSTLFGLLRQLKAARGRTGKPFAYVVSGQLFTRAGRIPFRDTGEIDLASGL